MDSPPTSLNLFKRKLVLSPSCPRCVGKSLNLSCMPLEVVAKLRKFAWLPGYYWGTGYGKCQRGGSGCK